MGFLKKLALNILETVGFSGSVRLYSDSALQQDGWFVSFKARQPVDGSGNPVPGYTYTFRHFLEPRLAPRFDVFEYGTGNSTMWFARRVKSVAAVDYATERIAQLSSPLPANASVMPARRSQSYIEIVKKLEKKFDIVVVNDIDLASSVLQVADILASDGVVILNHSEAEECKRVSDVLLGLGFKKVDFWGIGPVVHSEFCSTVFYRQGNCLGI